MHIYREFTRMCTHKMFVSKAIIIFLFFKCIVPILALNSMNNYGDNAYPGRCVVNFGSSVVLLKFGESVQLESLPCTSIFCMGDGYGNLRTCDFKRPPDDCRYTKVINWDADYPKCCKRRIVCD